MDIQFEIRQIPVHYLKMLDKPKFKDFSNYEYSFTKIEKPINTEQYYFLYKLVGLGYNWLDRLVIPESNLILLINDSKTHIFELKIKNELAGWAEFVTEPDYTELLYFGLLPNFVGKGLGKFFLSLCIKQAWEFNIKWIQLNTCDLDHPNALPVYKSLGFIEYKTTMEERKILTNN